MSLIQLLNLREVETGLYIIPRFEMPHFQMRVFENQVAVASGQCHLWMAARSNDILSSHHRCKGAYLVKNSQNCNRMILDVQQHFHFHDFGTTHMVGQALEIYSKSLLSSSYLSPLFFLHPLFVMDCRMYIYFQFKLPPYFH